MSKIKLLPLPDAQVVYYPDFLGPEVSEHLFRILEQETPWKQDSITLFGKTYPQPRLTAFYGQQGQSYSYSSIRMQALPFTDDLLLLKAQIESKTGKNYNSCLLNLYRDGQDSNGWHADDEKELGTDPCIASLSLGSPRWFHLKHKRDKTLKHKMELENGSLLFMGPGTQRHWLHQIPKTKKVIGRRINLTFRKLL